MRNGEAQRDGVWLDVAADARAGVHGRHASVRAERDGTIELGLHGAPPLSLRVRTAVDAHGVRVSPLRWERSLGAAVREQCDVLPDRAAVALCWSGGDDGRIGIVATCDPRVTVTVLDDRRLVLRNEAGGGWCIAASQATLWRIEAAADAFRFTIESALPLSLAFGACDDAGAPAAGVEAVLRDPALAARMVDAALARLRASTLDLDVADERIAKTFAFARAALRSAAPTADAAVAHPMVRGLVCAGDFDAAADWLRALRGTESIESDAHAVLAHAVYLSATGDATVLATGRPAITGALERLAAAEPGPDPSAAALLAAAWRDGARLAASAAGLGDVAATLHSRARRSAGAPALPTVVHAASSTTGRLGARAWQAFEVDRPAAGVVALGEMAVAALADAVTGDLEPLAAAACCTAIGSGLLGVEPDAPRDRLVLRPRLAAGLLPARASGIRAGDATFDLTIATAGDRFTIDVEQTAGAVPVQLVLEAWVPAPAWHAVRVDGRPAELNVAPLDGGWVFPIQLVPDQSRRVEVDLDANAGPP